MIGERVAAWSMVGIVEEHDDDLQSVIDRALRRSSLPTSDEALAGVPLQPADPPPPLEPLLDDGD